MNHILLSLILIATFPAYGMDADVIDNMNVSFDREQATVRAWIEQETKDGEHVILTTVSREIFEGEFTVFAIQSNTKKNGIKNARIKRKVEPDSDTVDKLKHAANLRIKNELAGLLPKLS